MIIERNHSTSVDLQIAQDGENEWSLSPQSQRSIVLERRDIWAWYSYDAANQVYASLTITVIAPLLLTYLATNRGCADLDYGCDFNGDPVSSEESSTVNFLGVDVKPASYSSFVISLSVIIQFISFMLFGPAADYGTFRKTLLLVTATLGSTITILQSIIGFSKSNWLLVGVLFMITNTLFGLSIIYYNAYLPVLAEYHVRVVDGINAKDETQVEALVDDVENEMSAKGFAIGYCTSLISVSVALVILWRLQEVTTEEFGIVGTRNGNDMYEVDQRYNLRLTGLKVWSNQDDILYGIQLHYEGFGWANIIGTRSGTEEASDVNNTNYYEKLKAYSIDNMPTGLSFYRTRSALAERFGNTTAFQNEHTFNASSDLVLGGVLAYLDNEKTRVQGLNFYYFNPNGIHDTRGLCIALMFSGLWWLIGTCAGIGLNLRTFPGKTLPHWNLVALSLQRIYGTVVQARKLPNLWKFLIAYFIFSDGYNTISYTGVLIGMEIFDMTALSVGFMILILLITASVGNLFYWAIQVRYSLSAKEMLKIMIFVFILLCIWPLLGLSDVFGFGLIHVSELYIYVVIFGFHLGPIQSFARIILCNLIPVNCESEIFCLWEITDKGSSWVGPFVIGLLHQTAGMRYGFFYILGIFCVSIPVICSVDVEEGKKQAARTGKEVITRRSTRNSQTDSRETGWNKWSYM